MWSVYKHDPRRSLAAYISGNCARQAYSPEALARLSSCAWAPLRKPPPGCRAEAKLRASTRVPGSAFTSRWAACNVVSLTTSNVVGTPVWLRSRCSRCRKTCGNCSGAYKTERDRAEASSSPRVTRVPLGCRYLPSLRMVTVSWAICNRFSRLDMALLPSFLGVPVPVYSHMGIRSRPCRSHDYYSTWCGRDVRIHC